MEEAQRARQLEELYGGDQSLQNRGGIASSHGAAHLVADVLKTAGPLDAEPHPGSMSEPLQNPERSRKEF